jgi:cytochrome c-type biogenesis protein CcmH/NrfG
MQRSFNSSVGCIISKATAIPPKSKELNISKSRLPLVSLFIFLFHGQANISSDQNDAQSWYLLGRCYMSQQKYPKAYEAYQQAVYRDGKNPTFWCSIGVLYYQINQYRDALDAYSRAIRLNPNISEVWYDLGTLVSPRACTPVCDYSG